jgi:uncharacterized protein YbaR (Trm112 family)
MSAKKKRKGRSAEALKARAARQVLRDRERLVALEVGGAPDRPFEVSSSSVIPVRARSQRCPHCRGELRLDEETAEKVDGHSLRAAHMTCLSCGVKRALWFRISPPLPN